MASASAKKKTKNAQKKAASAKPGLLKARACEWGNPNLNGLGPGDGPTNPNAPMWFCGAVGGGTGPEQRWKTSRAFCCHPKGC